MTFQPKPQYLPTDVKAYSAPRSRVVEYALMFVAACLALVAWAEPNDVPEADYNQTQRFVAAAASGTPALDCPRLNGNQWLYAAIRHEGDRMAESRCFYGHGGARFVQ